jgi:hypothetical protein
MREHFHFADADLANRGRKAGSARGRRYHCINSIPFNQQAFRQESESKILLQN